MILSNLPINPLSMPYPIQLNLKSYSQAIQDPRWIDAMAKELASLEANNTWEVVELPQEKTVGCKWVYRVKYNSDDTVERFKARLVAKGYTQTEGIDYSEIFAPVAKMVTVRAILAIAAVKGWEVHQLDVNNAFLHGDLDEEVYMVLPPGYQPSTVSSVVCKLTKSLYGLKQASRQWFAKLTEALLHLGFVQSHSDYTLFTQTVGSSFTAALVYVDDIIVAGNDLFSIHSLKQFLHDKFSIKNLGPIKYYLGIEVVRSSQGFHLSQRKYALDLLTTTGLNNAKPLTIPFDPNTKLLLNEGPLLDNPSLYRQLVGKLLYLTVTRPDLAFAAQCLSQFVQSPRLPHLHALHRVLRYVKASPGQGLFFSSATQLQLKAYCDSDWGGGGVIIPMTGSPLQGFACFWELH